MKAVIYNHYGGLEVLEFQEVSDPKPKPYEVLIKIASISLNPVDAKARRGGFRPVSDLLKFPRVTGTDFSGVIIETGKNVSGFNCQDRPVPKIFWVGPAGQLARWPKEK